MSSKRERRGGERGECVAKGRERLASFQAIRVITGAEFRKTRQPIGDAFNRSKPGGPGTDGCKKGWKKGGGDFVVQSLKRLVTPTPSTVRLSQPAGALVADLLEFTRVSVPRRLTLRRPVENHTNFFEGNESAIHHFIQARKNLVDALLRFHHLQYDRQVL